MKTRLICATLLLLVGTSSANAELVIDNFDQAQSVNSLGVTPVNPVALNDDVAGSRSIFTPSPSSATVTTGGVGGGGFSIVDLNPAAGATATVVYELASALDFINTPLVNLSLDLFENVVGDWQVTVRFNGTVDTMTGPIFGSGTGFSPVVVSTAGSGLNFKGVDLGNNAVASNVTSIAIDFEKLSTGAGQIVSNTSPAVTANPEPASLLLLGATGAFGGCWARRRKKLVKEA